MVFPPTKVAYTHQVPKSGAWLTRYARGSRLVENGQRRGVAQFGLARLTGGQEVAGSNPVAPISASSDSPGISE